MSHQRVNAMGDAVGYSVSLKRKDGSMKNIEVLGGVENLVAQNAQLLGLVPPFASCFLLLHKLLHALMALFAPPP